MSQILRIKSIRDAIRLFNRRAGVLKLDPYGVGLSLSQSSALVDLHRMGPLTASQLTQLLQLEKSSVSRLLIVIAARDLVKFKSSSNDRRKKIITLTARGRKTAERINEISDLSVQEVLDHLNAVEQTKLVEAFNVIAQAVRQLSK